MKKILKSFFVLTIIVSAWYSSGFFASAAPYFNKVFELKQPDNSKVQVVVSGDEYYQEIEGLNGYTLCRDSKGWICYAKLNQDGTQYISDGQAYKGEKDIVQGGISKHIRISNESISKIRQATMKSLHPNSTSSICLAGNTVKASAVTNQNYISSASDSAVSKDLVNGVTILIDFPDQKSDISKDEIDNFFNQTGYTGFNNNGSVKDYFYDVSGGKMIYRNIVVGFYTAKYPKAHYDNPNLDESICGSELGEEALKWLVSTNIDLSALT
ncbi:MAG: metalloprotease, partial [Bacillota bacterium]|nr:metalloprotease [Bacillota bacterium]